VRWIELAELAHVRFQGVNGVGLDPKRRKDVVSHRTPASFFRFRMPGGTRSFVLLCDDPDAPAGTWHHWAAYDLPPTVTELAVGAAQNKNIKQAVNDFRKMGYGGPCPPHGNGPHHYHFRLLALSTDHLSAKTNSSCPEVEREARKYAIAEATLVGWYER
jgi:Raf kinase inhibitor-like YbhB/YbcL family protein